MNEDDLRATLCELEAELAATACYETYLRLRDLVQQTKEMLCALLLYP